MLSLYNAVWHAGLALALVAWPLLFVLPRRPYRGLCERFAAYPAALGDALAGSRPIWVHAASVGEVRSAAALFQCMKSRWPERKLLLSTATATGRQTGWETLPQVDAVTYLPLDLPWLVSRSLRRLRPEVIVVLETEIWPNFILAAHRRRIPLVVLSGRLSPRGAALFKRFRRLFRPVLERVSAFGMQDEENARRLLDLGVDPARVTVTGSLKHVPHAAGAEPPADLPGFGPGPVLVAGSTHKGEEEMLLDVLPGLRRRFPRLLMILAPRHPERFAEVGRLLRQRELRFCRRSQAEGIPSGEVGVLLWDTLGELPRVYGCADVAFVGGTLVPVGGHNLLEPARWAKPVLFGPHHANVAAVARALLESGGGVEVHGSEDLQAVIGDLLAAPARAAAMGRAAAQAAVADTDVLSRSMRLVSRQLARGASGGGLGREPVGSITILP